MNAFPIVFLSFNKTIKPKPELTNKPANKAPNDKLPEMNNSVIKIDEAQLGIRPIIEANKGAK